MSSADERGPMSSEREAFGMRCGAPIALEHDFVLGSFLRKHAAGDLQQPEKSGFAGNRELHGRVGSWRPNVFPPCAVQIGAMLELVRWSSPLPPSQTAAAFDRKACDRK